MLRSIFACGLLLFAVASNATATSSAHASTKSTTRAVARALIAMINADRALHHRKPLILDHVQSRCSLEHAKHMALQGSLSHDDFPRDICVRHTRMGENVGMAPGDALAGAAAIHQSMMAEGPCPDRGCPGKEFEQHGHYINLVSRTFTRIGIGVYISGGSVWITEDFTDGKSGS